MSPAQLFSNFDRVSEATDAIPRLRRFIFDLAVRGKLVEQDAREEPATELLKRIQEKKSRLLSAGEMKKEKPLPVIEGHEIPFAIPTNWRWVRLNDVTSYLQRGKSPKYATGDGLPVISQKCVQWRGLDLDSAKRITRESIEDYEAIRFLRSGDLLWNSTGTGTIGRIIKVKEPPPKLVCDSHVTVVRCLEVDAEYVRSWLRSDHVYAVIEDRAAGSTNQVELTSQLAINQVVPLPPLAEQHRIVAKVDELMALCDRLEASQAELESRRDRLVASSLNRLNNGADADAFRDHARFTLDNLPRLTTRLEYIQQLRQTILNLAVRGQLVSQDPNDEPASELLRRIEAWRSAAIDEKKIRTPRKPLLGIEDSDAALPYQLPQAWSWARLGELIYIHSGDGLTSESMENGSIPVFGGNGVTGSHNKPNVHRPTVVIGRVGYYCGSVHLTPPQAWVTDNAFITEFCSDAISQSFLVLLLRSTNLKENESATAQPVISGAKIYPIIVGLPPLTEQHRIVAKVEELMALCDRLEAQLTTTQAESRRLLEAVLQEALTS